MSLSHDNLMNIYQMNFLLMKVHGISIAEIDAWMPWEREVYVTLLQAYLEELKKKQAQG